TLAGIPAASQAASSTSLEVIAGVEITAEFHERELHLLGYFVDPDNPSLLAALDDVCRGRVERFHAMVERLRADGVSLDVREDDLAPNALGRRHLAELLVARGKAGSVREAFQRWLKDGGRAAVAKKRLPVADAIALVRAAGGVAAWAHPSYDGETFARLRE